MNRYISTIGLILLFFNRAMAQDPSESIKLFFDAFHERDTFKLKQLLHPNLTLQSLLYNKEQTNLVIESVPDFLNSIAEIPEGLDFKEELLKLKTQQDEVMAHVWVPYRFYVSGELSHTGINSFTLIKDQNKWMIIYLIDTRYPADKPDER